MKMGHFEMVTMLLAAAVLMDIFQVKAEVLDMAENAFDDEYLKCKSRMETKYIPQMEKEEQANDALLRTVWDNAEIQWEARKAQLFLPRNFKDPYGIALTAFLTEAQEQTPFYHTFNGAVKMAGLSRRRYIYNFPFKAFHFYLVRALQLLRRPCEKSYKTVVYSTSPDISFTFGEQNQVRLGNFTLAYSAKPETANNHRVLTIQTCFGVAVGKFLNKEAESVVLIPLSEVFQVSRKGTSDDLILQSINNTCSYYECAFLGGLKTENCIANSEYIDPRHLYNPDMDSQKLEDSGRKNFDPARMPDSKELQTEENPLLPDEKPEVKERPTILLQVRFQVRSPIPLHPLAIHSFRQSQHPPFYSSLLL
ncbi:ecto-ADP-ribosyltransferase 3 isoform X1 [Mus pahari]|uniref:ecto-ADP-ribosyltransferase 3 isoform X1 n=1 Tax=Mus pahari TaxID=10093 RepID=UPI001114DAF7|nr:ecto-ADP-ribosyltransferase 3 isoform X1 [Mus pahari]